MPRWRYEGLAEGGCAALANNKWIVENEGMLKEQLLHLMDKAYQMGLEDGARRAKNSEGAIPIRDMSDIPEVFERVKDRWEPGVCN